MTRTELETEIQHMTEQREIAIRTAMQAEGAISALKWVLDNLEDEKEEE